MTANGTVGTNEEATVYSKDLDIFLFVELVDGCPAVLSLRMLCATDGLFTLLNDKTAALSNERRNHI